MKIDPMPGVVYIKIEKAKVGAFDTSSRDSVVERAEVLGLGTNTDELNLKVGDKIHVKASWAADIIDDGGERYIYIHKDTNGILAKVSDE